MRPPIIALLVLTAAPALAQPQQPPAEPAAERAQQAAAFAAEEAKRYEIRLADATAPLQLAPQPLLRWSNPTTGDVYGSVHVWTADGCPAAVASIYRYFDRAQINVELVSLSAAPLAAERNGRPRWSAEAGVRFEPIAGAPAPAATAERRALQMRTLARRFKAELGSRDDDEKLEPLRLMAKPLVEYQATDDSHREGAVFAFVTTNDPELLLLIESRRHDGTTLYDVPRLAPPWEPLRGPKGTYLILQWDTLEAAEQDR